MGVNNFTRCETVSTHSRLKAAGCQMFVNIQIKISFNTQPPEGGWSVEFFNADDMALFQHTAA